MRAWASFSKACTGRRPTTATDLQKTRKAVKHPATLLVAPFPMAQKGIKGVSVISSPLPWSHNGPLCLIKLQHTNQHLYSVTSHLAPSAVFDSLEGNKTVFQAAIDVSSTVIKCLVWHKPLGSAPGFNTLTQWPNCAITMWSTQAPQKTFSNRHRLKP